MFDGLIENIKKIKSWERVDFFFFGGGGSSEKNDHFEGGHVKKIGKLRGVMQFLYASQIPPAPPPS